MDKNRENMKCIACKHLRIKQLTFYCSKLPDKPVIYKIQDGKLVILKELACNGKLFEKEEIEIKELRV